MAVLEIFKDDAPMLKKSARSIRVVDDSIRRLAVDMIETMAVARGVGLAGNQVGEPRRIIVVLMDDGEPGVFINPRLKRVSREKVTEDEGCLSFPLRVAKVKRAQSVVVIAKDLDLKDVRLEVSDFTARIFQHEIDHLNGIVFLDRAEPDSIRVITPEEADDDDEDGEETAAEDDVSPAAAEDENETSR